MRLALNAVGVHIDGDRGNSLAADRGNAIDAVPRIKCETNSATRRRHIVSRWNCQTRRTGRRSLQTGPVR
jgi:hypothetical protein